jgi:hypothetical protein
MQQQGDVIIISINKLPKGKRTNVALKENRFVLAEGEATGHAHAIEGADVKKVEMFRIGDELFLDVKGNVVVKHEEHHHQTVEKGLYKIDIVREVDPFTEEVRKVTD